jgi:hypothetical protein
MTVDELIKALQRAVVMDELDGTSEVMNHNMWPALLTINIEHRHVVIE